MRPLNRNLGISLVIQALALSASVRAEVAIVQPMAACPEPHYDCPAACGTSCTYWSCEDHTTIPVSISQVPMAFIRAKPQCTERLETVFLGQLPLPEAQQSRVVDNVNKMPMPFNAHSYACVPHTKAGAACAWSFGNWSSCSARCGPGTQSRIVSCMGAYCDPATMPAATQACNNGPCDWAVGDWGTCSASCGGGTQSRLVTCGGAAGSCLAETMPSSTQACNTQSCTRSCTIKLWSNITSMTDENGWSIDNVRSETVTLADGESRFLYLPPGSYRSCNVGQQVPESQGAYRTCQNGEMSPDTVLQTFARNENEYLISLYGGIRVWLNAYFFSGGICGGAGSPLMIHLNSSADHVEPLVFTSPVDGILFNLLGWNAKPTANTPVHISWYRQPEYFFIVLPNANGEVKGIDELFGNNTKGPDGQFAADGYKALAKYDAMTADGKTPIGKPDGYITAEDPLLAQLRFWHDDNYDGKAQPSELRTADELGIELIDLAADPGFKETDKYGNDTTLKSVVRTKDGRYHVMFDVWFRYYYSKEFEMMKKMKSTFLINESMKDR